jgi:hypothetical protein
MVGSHVSIPKVFASSHSASQYHFQMVNCFMLVQTAGMCGAKLMRKTCASSWKRVATKAPWQSWREAMVEAQPQQHKLDSMTRINLAMRRFNMSAQSRQPKAAAGLQR